MTLNYTPRLGLNKPDQDEFQLVDVLNANMDNLDKNVGGRMVSAGIIPPVNELYDGLIVNERDTGKTWIASSNGSGGFDRAWIRYPLFFWGSSSAMTLGSGTASVARGVNWQAGINTSAADLSAGRFKVPISGVYQVTINAYYGAGPADGRRFIGLDINSGSSPYGTTDIPSNYGNFAYQQTYEFPQMTANAGTLFTPKFGQSSSATIDNCVVHLFVTLLTVTGKNNL